MGPIHIFAWIILNIYYISAQSPQKENTIPGYNHCKSSASDKVCGENIKDCCPNGWVLVDEACYYFENNERKSLIEAGKHCKNLNASIFIPNSWEELNNVFKHVHQYAETWIGVRKECQEKPHIDIHGKMDMRTLNWKNDPYIEEYSNITMFMCDAGNPNFGTELTGAMYPCVKTLRFVCERRPEPELQTTDTKNVSTSNNLAANASSDLKSTRTARMIPGDVTPDPKLNTEELMKEWMPERLIEDEDKISSEKELRRFLSEHDTKRIFFEELLLNRTESGEDEGNQTVYNIFWEYNLQEMSTNWNKEAYEKKLKLLKEATHNLDIDISRAEMNLKGNISLHEALLETLANSKKTFCASLARVKKERYLKSLTKAGN